VKFVSGALQVRSMRRLAPNCAVSSLGFGALIAPDECGADHFIAAVEEDSAMHLPGESDAGNLIVGGRGRGEDAPDG
jgi:hypothetical protein